MSKADGAWSSRLAVAAAFLFMMLSATRAQVRPVPSAQARKRMVQAVDKTLQEGLNAKLPPHLSTLLGLSQEQECLVRQGVVRTGKVVRRSDLSTANKNDFVLFVVSQGAEEL